jgi:hypothetical protein
MSKAVWRLVRANNDKPHRCPGCYAVMPWRRPELLRGRWSIYWCRPCRMIVAPVWHDHDLYSLTGEPFRLRRRR